MMLKSCYHADICLITEDILISSCFRVMVCQLGSEREDCSNQDLLDMRVERNMCGVVYVSAFHMLVEL